MPLPFNKALDVKLINLVKDNPALYNPRHAKYLDFDTREVAWQKIGDHLNRPAQVCKSRWINIRDMMRRRIRDRLRNPTQHHYNYKYEEELSFMIPFYKESTECDVEYEECIEESLVPAELLDDCEFVKDDKVNTKRSYSTLDSNDGPELDPHDALDVFLLAIGSTLRTLNPYFLNQAKSKIFQIVQDYELQQLVSKDQPASTSNG